MTGGRGGRPGPSAGNAYAAFTQNSPIDVWLVLGDNASNNATDTENLLRRGFNPLNHKHECRVAVVKQTAEQDFAQGGAGSAECMNWARSPRLFRASPIAFFESSPESADRGWGNDADDAPTIQKTIAHCHDAGRRWWFSAAATCDCTASGRHWSTLSPTSRFPLRHRHFRAHQSPLIRHSRVDPRRRRRSSGGFPRTQPRCNCPPRSRMRQTWNPMNSQVRIKFWGTRGSIARPGPLTVRYGGNTSCVEVTSAHGTKVIIDSGTGAYDLGHCLQGKKGGPTRGSLLISHTHWDHIQGFPFFAPLFVPGAQWDIYGPTGLGRSLRDGLAGQMEHTYFPVTLEEMGASIRFHDLVEGSFAIDDIRITTRYLNHPALTLGYRFETGGVIVVYACDHEPYSRTPRKSGLLHDLDRRHSEFLADADLVIHDAQFTDEEYASRAGWGHSPMEYVCEMAQLAGAKRVAFSHHDPGRTDDELDQLVTSLQSGLQRQGSALQIFAAADGQVVDLELAGSELSLDHGTLAEVPAEIAPAVRDPSVLIGVSDNAIAHLLEEAARSVGVRSTRGPDGDSVVRLARQDPPALVLLEDTPGGGDGLSVCRRLRSDPDPGVSNTLVVMVGNRERLEEGEAAGVTRWLITPFSCQYARAQLQAWLLRTGCRWVRAVSPPDEERRLASLRELSLLDTAAEERFDRLTRLAAAIADVPMVLVSLVDRDRQWFKSCQGLSVSQTPRDVSFCAHVLLSRTPLIVEDTLLDDRFADNPLVIGATRIRFYAGFPVFHTNGSCLGTLCLIDTRPRHLSTATIQRLEDLALLVQNELNLSFERILT